MEVVALSIPLTLSLQSIVPVIALGLGLTFLGRIVRRADQRAGELATAGIVLAVAGGSAHVAWKITLATAGNDAVILERALLGCMMPGFLFFAVGFLAATDVTRARRWARVLSRMANMLLVLGLAFGMSQSGVRALEVLLLVVTLATATVLILRAIWLARTRARNDLAALLVLSLFGSLIAGTVAAMDFTVARAWIDQLLRTGAHGMFAYAAWTLSDRYIPNRPEGEAAAPAEPDG